MAPETTDDGGHRYRARLAEKLADSLGGPIPEGTPRRVHGAVSLRGKATAVIGMRRSGKTTFLHQLRRERLAAGVARERLPFVNFEDEQLAGLRADQLHVLIEEYYRRFPALRRRQTVVWCLDEIQAVPGWERFRRASEPRGGHCHARARVGGRHPSLQLRGGPPAPRSGRARAA